MSTSTDNNASVMGHIKGIITIYRCNSLGHMVNFLWTYPLGIVTNSSSLYVVRSCIFFFF